MSGHNISNFNSIANLNIGAINDFDLLLMVKVNEYLKTNLVCINMYSITGETQKNLTFISKNL